ISTAVISRRDKSVWPLFSDAGSATLLGKKDGEEFSFNLQTDGSEYDDIIIPEGGMRYPLNSESLLEKACENGNYRAGIHMKLDGIKIFNFALREIAPNIQSLLQSLGMNAEELTCCVFHQANKLMLESVRKKLNIPSEKFLYSLYSYGNTSSASIPVTLVTEYTKLDTSSMKNVLLCGFGVGLSWGSVLLNMQNTFILPLLETP
ncbi:MAG: hypothetical protein NZ522_01875, partial [Chitinophagales bacterium]|nr:hypothetical protein [Chitinophagales bacterium]